MYEQNCIQKYFYFLHDRLNWLFHVFIFIYKKYFASRIKSFVMCKKKLYQTPLLWVQKKMYKMIQFTLFYYIRFCNT